jgi:hypothetical protein
MSAHRSVFEHPAISSTLVACFPPILQVRPQQDEPPDHFAAPFRSGALPRSSSRWRVALGCKIVTAFQRHRSTSKVRQALTAGVEASTTRPLATTRWLGFAHRHDMPRPWNDMQHAITSFRHFAFHAMPQSIIARPRAIRHAPTKCLDIRRSPPGKPISAARRGLCRDQGVDGRNYET